MGGAAALGLADRDQGGIDPGQRDRSVERPVDHVGRLEGRSELRPGRPRDVRPVGRCGLRRLLEALDQLPHAFVGVPACAHGN